MEAGPGCQRRSLCFPVCSSLGNTERLSLSRRSNFARCFPSNIITFGRVTLPSIQDSSASGERAHRRHGPVGPTPYHRSASAPRRSRAVRRWWR